MKPKRPILTLNLSSLSEETKNKIIQKTAIKSEPAKKKLLMPNAKYQSMLKIFQTNLPEIFPTKSPYKVFKIGIHHDLYEFSSNFSKTTIRNFLKIYCRSTQYKKVRILGALRYDLSNNVVDKVTEKQIV